MRLDSAANTEPSAIPTGVASTNPAFGVSSRTRGVARACSPRKPADDRNVNATSNTRGSPRRSAAAPMPWARTALSKAVSSTNQKCEG
jgi:hypothetical protein